MDKWEWNNHDIFTTSKVITTTPQKLQSTNWEEEEEDMNESFNLSASASDVASAQSSITGSSLKEGKRMAYDEFIGGAEVNGNTSCTGEAFMGLKLGKRTYFENNIGRSEILSFSAVSSSSSSSRGKKAKSSSTLPPPVAPRCRVEGCNLDLSSAKEYHRKHRVCESHSKCPKVVVSGVELRFCQQCSRFHRLAEFDEKKRSCRRRLSDHNARRRKPRRQETIHFNSTDHHLSSSSSFIYYGGEQQLSFESRPAAVSSTWKNTTKSSRILDGISTQFPDAVIDFSRPVPSVLDQGGLKDESLSSPNVDALRALSLLSNNNNSNSNSSSWGGGLTDLVHPTYPMGATDNNYLFMGLQTLSSPDDYWQHSSALPPTKTSTQLFNRIYSNHMLL